MANSRIPQSPAPPTSPLLIFVLGAPCSGKSTLSTTLSKHYNLTHFSLGAELRSLVSPNPTGAAALLKPKFTPEELSTFAANIRAGTLGPAHQAPKYVCERIFPEDGDPSKVRMLVDGFPRKAERWITIRHATKGVWVPDERTVVVVLTIEKKVACRRFIERGREGDVFERRFDEHEREIEETLEAMKKDGIGVAKVDVHEEMSVDEVIAALERNEVWRRAVCPKEHEGSGLNP